MQTARSHLMTAVHLAAVVVIFLLYQWSIQEDTNESIISHRPPVTSAADNHKVLLRFSTWTDCRETLWATNVLRRAWRRVALSTHPDKGGSAEALERSKEVLDLLSSPIRLVQGALIARKILLFSRFAITPPHLN